MAEDKPRIGFVGLGLMGQAFTRRLVACGYQVTGHDIDGDKIKLAEGHGVAGAASAADVAAASDIVQVCVIDTSAVDSVVFGPGGVAEADPVGKVLVDHSTTVVQATRDMAARLEADSGMAWVDAPVSGGPPAAEEGSLAIMAGGTDIAIAVVAPVMEQLAGVFTHMGPVGAGQVTKMINQVLVLTNYAVIAEAAKLAEAGGIDAEKIPAALATGHAGSNLLNALYPRILARDFEPLGRARQILKDLDMLHDLTKQLHAPTPMADQARTLFRLLCSRGHQDLDGAAIFKLYDKDPV